MEPDLCDSNALPDYPQLICPVPPQAPCWHAATGSTALSSLPAQNTDSPLQDARSETNPHYTAIVPQGAALPPPATISGSVDYDMYAAFGLTIAAGFASLYGMARR